MLNNFLTYTFQMKPIKLTGRLIFTLNHRAKSLFFTNTILIVFWRWCRWRWASCRHYLIVAACCLIFEFLLKIKTSFFWNRDYSNYVIMKWSYTFVFFLVGFDFLSEAISLFKVECGVAGGLDLLAALASLCFLAVVVAAKFLGFIFLLNFFVFISCLNFSITLFSVGAVLIKEIAHLKNKHMESNSNR